MKERSFGIIPVRKEGDEILFLIVRHNSGHWGFPKGHARAGESEHAAARREFTEETGISNCDILKSVSFTENYHFAKNGTPVEKTVRYFLGIVENERVTLQKGELQDYRWALFEDALGAITFDGSKSILRQAKRYLDNNTNVWS
ncbi:MAG: NUDIX domain-containing protein [Patescibacteria group bacterium]|nr:MAG: NUDIX domain-containing protein [Patescibacteria group bacterium]